MIIVYWRQALLDSTGGLVESQAQFAEFKSNEMGTALKQCEALRELRRNGAFISHVCIQSELPDAVGEAGVADIDPLTYSWYKRRINPAIPLGRERKDL